MMMLMSMEFAIVGSVFTVHCFSTTDIYVETVWKSTITVPVAISISVDGVVRLIFGVLYNGATVNIIADVIVFGLKTPLSAWNSTGWLDAVSSVGLLSAFDAVIQLCWVNSSITARSIVVLLLAGAWLIRHDHLDFVGQFIREGFVPPGVDLASTMAVDERHLVLADEI